VPRVSINGVSQSDGRQTFAAMFEGYQRSLDRLQVAVKTKKAAEVFIVLFEALNWAVALDERTARHWAPDGKVLSWRWRQRVPGAAVMAGIRFARNRVHHQWADVLGRAEGGFTAPLSAPLVSWEWVWRTADALPQGNPDAVGEGVYRASLAGRPARVTLTELSAAFAFLRRVLEPSSLIVSTADQAAFE
jgi:hypothetical protein